MSAEPFLLTGGCHCRALRYTLTAPPLGAYVCHCTDCQSLSGAAFAIGVVVPAPAFTLAGSPRLIRRVLGSGTGLGRDGPGPSAQLDYLSVPTFAGAPLSPVCALQIKFFES